MKQFVVCAVLIAFLSVSAFAAESTSIDTVRESAQQEITSGMTGTAQNTLGDISLDDCTDLANVFRSLWENSAKSSAVIVQSAFLTIAKTAVVMILCGCAAGFSSTARMPPLILTMAGALGITAVIAGDLTGMMSLCSTTAEELSVLSTSMMPVIMTSVSLCGAPASGAILYTATIFALNLCITLITSVLLPAVSAYIAMITVNAALGNGMLTRLAEFIRWITAGSLKILVTVFIAYITVFGSIGHSVDSSTIRAAKFALSGTVPVVGGILSNAAETVLSSASVLKNTIGLFGMVCVVAVCLVPFLRIGINYLLFRAGTAVLSPICPPSLLGLMDGITNSLSLILGMLGSCCAIVFFELVFAVVFLTGS